VHSGSVEWVAFSPDGETLATLGWDGDLVLADPDTANPRARTRPGPSDIRGSFSYTSDGETIVIGFEDGLVVAHDVDPDSWLDHACRVTGRDLTAAEWRDLIGSGAPARTCGGR
jgi:WD40 repeat protein